MTTRKMRPSGTFNRQKPATPTLAPYPPMVGLDMAQNIKGTLSYIIKGYSDIGISVLISKPNKDNIEVQCADWTGAVLDINASDRLSVIANRFVSTELVTFMRMMSAIKLPAAQYFFAVEPDDSATLVDMRINDSKFAGPGMLRDIFSKICRTQEVIKVEIIDERVCEHASIGIGSYAGDLIIKPSVFKNRIGPDGSVSPFYIKIRR